MPIASPGELHLPFPSRGGRRLTRPTARSVSRFVWITTLSWYVPASTATVSPGEEASTAAWMDSPG